MSRPGNLILLGILLNCAKCIPADTNYIFMVIDYPGIPSGTVVTGINNIGQIVGYYFSMREHGFLKSGDTFMTIDYPGTSSDTIAYGINDSGQIVGYYFSDRQHGFLDDGGLFTTIDYPGNISLTAAYDINNRGQIVGTYQDGLGYHGFLESGGAFAAINYPGTLAGTVAYGINDTGQIVGIFSDLNGTHGFLEDGGSFTALDYPGSTNGTQALGINNPGQIVGYSYPYGFLYTNGAYLPFLITDASFNGAEDINDASQIVGGVTAGSQIHGFLATCPSPSGDCIFQPVPVPEPATWPALAGCLTLVVAVYRRMRY